MTYKLIKKKNISDKEVLLNIEISDGYIKKSLTKAYKNISSKANIPGFRKGNVPHNIIDLNFGKQYVLGEAANIAISDLYPKIINDNDVKPIDYPKIKIIKLEENKPVALEIAVEVEPSAKLPKYKGIKATDVPAEVTEEDVEKQVDLLRNNYASLEPVEKDQDAKTGDYAVIDFKGTIEGEEFEGGSAEDFNVEIGSKTLFEKFEESIIGMKPGDDKKITLLLPENIKNRELSGKLADFEIKLKELKKKVLPEINEEFLGSIGDYKNEEELRNSIKDGIKEQKVNARKASIFGEIMDYLVENSSLDIPEVMIDNRVERLINDFEKGLKQQNVKREDYLKMVNISEDVFKKQMRTRSEREIKEYLVLDALEKAEGKKLEPSGEEINNERENAVNSARNDQEKGRVEKYLETEAGKNDLAANIKRRKIIDLLIDNAKLVKEKESKKEKSSEKEFIADTDSNSGEKDKTEDKDKKLWVPGDKK